MIDKAFERYIRLLVGERQYDELREKVKRMMLLEFEMSVKRCFTGDDKKYSVDLRGVEDSPQEGIEDETIPLAP